MAEDINKKISVDVELKANGQEQVENYKAAFDSLRNTISALGKPFTDLSGNIKTLSSDIEKMADAVIKSTGKITTATKNARDQQAKINADSNQKLKSNLSEADKMREQVIKEDLDRRFSYTKSLIQIEADQYKEQKSNLDSLLKYKEISEEEYYQASEGMLKDYKNRITPILVDYTKNGGVLQLKSLGAPDAALPNNVQVKPADMMSNVWGSVSGKKSKSIFESTKDTINKVLKLFVKSEDDKSKAATDANGKTNTKIINSAKTLQDIIGAKTIENTQLVSDTSFKIFTKGLQLQTNARIKKLEGEKNKELSNANLTATDKINIEAKYQKKETDVKKAAFKEQQKADIAQAIINGAVAITKVTAQTGIGAPIAIGTIIANTAAQVAKISKEKFTAAKGGYFKSDGKGTILPGYSRTDNTNAYLRSGEAIVVSEAMRDPWARNLVSAINVAYGGRDFSVPHISRGYAVGGIFTDGGNASRYYNQPVNDQKNLANTVAYQMINNFPPVYVDVKDVNNQQNILAQTINRVNL